MAVDPNTVINAALALIDFGMKAATAANNGDQDAAEAFMKQAQDHVTSAIAGWNAAPGPST